MPKIVEIREIDGEIWCRVGKPGEFPKGIALCTPEEQEEKYREGYRDGYDDAAEKPDDCREALKWLVALKAHKEEHGKTPHYEEMQPKAWARAKDALSAHIKDYEA